MPAQTSASDSSKPTLLRRLGLAIGNARKRRRMTQQQLADAAGVSRLTIVRAEAGHSGVAQGALIGILGALGLAEALIEAVEADTVGEALERARIVLPRIVRPRRALED